MKEGELSWPGLPASRKGTSLAFALCPSACVFSQIVREALSEC